MDLSHSPAFEPVSNRLKSVYDKAVAEPLPVGLDRLLEALDDAYARGDLVNRARLNNRS